MSNLAMIMFPHHRLLRLILASNGMDSVFFCTTLPFGWKISPYIFHTIGLVALRYLRARGIPCSLYIDDQLNGELITSRGPWSVLPENRGQEYTFGADTAAIYRVLSLLVDLGYTIGNAKSVLYPTTSVEYLGLTVDSLKQAFIVPGQKIDALAVLRKKTSWAVRSTQT